MNDEKKQKFYNPFADDDYDENEYFSNPFADDDYDENEYIPTDDDWDWYWRYNDYLFGDDPDYKAKFLSGRRKSNTVNVPSILWKGKPSKSVIKAMRPKEEGGEGFSEAVIAYVLFNWCGIKNKTQLGRLLGKPDQDDSSYRRLTARLLKEATSLTITHD